MVATKDRPEELRRLWTSLLAQTRVPDEVVVVDAGARPTPRLPAGAAAPVAAGSSGRPSPRPRASATSASTPSGPTPGSSASSTTTPSSKRTRSRRWSASSPRPGPGVGGAAFNMVNHPPLEWAAPQGDARLGRLARALRPPRRGRDRRPASRRCIGPVETDDLDRLAADAGPRSGGARSSAAFRFDEWFARLQLSRGPRLQLPRRPDLPGWPWSPARAICTSRRPAAGAAATPSASARSSTASIS
ncbi:MAG: hypothetical protein MZV64_10825 [Ignavibacteriales bacterium]|nr:hypothetical protein [Ignavibacteriales bacterium]